MATASEHVDDEDLDQFDQEDLDGIRFLDDDEARELFDRQARRLLGISGDEFLRRYDAGEYTATQDDRELDAVMTLRMLTDLVRSNPA